MEKRDRLEVQLRGKYRDEVVNDLLRLVDKFINYNEKFLNYWRNVGGEAKELIEDLTNGGAEVIIWESEKGISVHYGHMTLDVHRTSTGVTTQLRLKGFRGVTIRVPDVFRRTMSEEEYAEFINKILKALEMGLEETDGYVEYGKAAMNTTQIWQAIIWSLLYPGENYVHIDSINANEDSATIKWHMRSSHSSLKGILNGLEKLSEESLLAFMLTAILGDGSAFIERNGRGNDRAVIKITMSSSKFDRWESILNRLQDMEFGWNKSDNGDDSAIIVRFVSGNAIDLARAMISILPLILRDVLDALGFEKWERIKRIAEMEVRWRRGEAQVIIAGYGFTVDVRKDTVMLERKVKDYVEMKNIIDALRAVYGNGLQTRANKSGKYLAVIIPMYVFEKYSDIKEKVIEVLCRKLKRTKDERKKQIITKHLTRLTTPTERQPRC